MARTLPSSATPTLDDRLAAIDAAIRQLGFSITAVAAEVGEVRGELTGAAHPARPARPGHLKSLPDPAARAPLPATWAAHQLATAAATGKATRR
jgi:hypothetical protein